jgi:hypothetical protein
MKALLIALGLSMLNVMNLVADEPRLATASTKVEDAVMSANAVMISKFISLGNSDFGPPGEMVYQGAIVEVSSSLKGDVGNRMSCSFRVRTSPPEKSESLPQIGSEYVIAGSPLGGGFEIGKLLSATPENIALVRGIIDNTAITPQSSEAEPKRTDQVLPQPGPPKEQPAKPHTPPRNPQGSIQSPPNAEPTASTPWSVIVILTAAALGLLWWLVKNRK